MKKAMLVLALSLSVTIQLTANATNEKPLNATADNAAEFSAMRLEAPAEFEQQDPAVPSSATDTQVAAVSTTETKHALIKTDLDEEAGRVDWRTAVIVLCVAFLVYVINRKKRQDIE